MRRHNQPLIDGVVRRVPGPGTHDALRRSRLHFPPRFQRVFSISELRARVKGDDQEGGQRSSSQHSQAAIPVSIECGLIASFSSRRPATICEAITGQNRSTKRSISSGTTPGNVKSSALQMALATGSILLPLVHISLIRSVFLFRIGVHSGVGLQSDLLEPHNRPSDLLIPQSCKRPQVARATMLQTALYRVCQKTPPFGSVHLPNILDRLVRKADDLLGRPNADLVQFDWCGWRRIDA